MANTPQSKKRARQNERRYAVNKARRSRIRTYLRKVEEAIASGNKDDAQAALRAALEKVSLACGGLAHVSSPHCSIGFLPV